MKNIKAVLTAFFLFLVTVAGFQGMAERKMPNYNIRYGTWIQSSKFSSNQALRRLMADENAVPVFGSSELRHCQKTGFHADSIYADSEMKPVFIGAGGYQSLIHAITIGSMGDTLKGRKVVLSVSPQWFKNAGVKKDAFGASYSESNFIAFLQNPDISDDTREYVIGRLKTLTDENAGLWDRIQEDVRWYRGGTINLWDCFRKNIHSALTAHKSQMKLLFHAEAADIWNSQTARKNTKPINWQKYYKKAEKKGKKKTGQNALGMLDKVYNKKYKKHVEKNTFQKMNYYSTESVEFQDLECFLRICREENIEVMILMLPFNGRWCDYLELPAQSRAKFYEKVRKIAEENAVQFADMSQYEYADYIFEDDSHLALKGLVIFNEKIYDFYKQSVE